MKMTSIKTNEPPAHVSLITNIAIMFFCLAGIPVIMGWIPASFSPFSDSAVLVKSDQRSASAVKQADRKIPKRPALVASDAPAKAIRAEHADIEPVLKVDAKVEGSGYRSETDGNNAPSQAIIISDVTEEK